MILLTDEKIKTIGCVHTNFNRDRFGASVAKAQLKKVHDKIESMVADGWYLSAILKALLDEVKDV